MHHERLVLFLLHLFCQSILFKCTSSSVLDLTCVFVFVSCRPESAPVEAHQLQMTAFNQEQDHAVPAGQSSSDLFVHCDVVDDVICQEDQPSPSTEEEGSEAEDELYSEDVDSHRTEDHVTTQTVADDTDERPIFLCKQCGLEENKVSLSHSFRDVAESLSFIRRAMNFKATTKQCKAKPKFPEHDVS